MTETHFATREAAQEFANLRSMVDGHVVDGPYRDGAMWVVYSRPMSNSATASL